MFVRRNENEEVGDTKIEIKKGKKSQKLSLDNFEQKMEEGDTFNPIKIPRRETNIEESKIISPTKENNDDGKNEEGINIFDGPKYFIEGKEKLELQEALEKINLFEQQLYEQKKWKINLEDSM